MQRPVVIAIAAVAVIVVGIVVYVQFTEEPPPPEPEPAPALPPPEPEPVVPEPEPPRMELPPLDESDAIVRGLMEGLSAHPRLADSMPTEALVRAFVASVVAIASGESPRALLLYLEPSESFGIAERDGLVVIDPASFERYTWMTGVFSSLDSTGAAEQFRRLEPLFDEAYRELGYPEGSFRQVLDTAMNLLASTPVPDGYLEVQRGQVFWEFKDPTLERLSTAQKHLLRMGPANARMVQSKLRELQAALSR